jgi:hypothetical protein
VNNFTLTRGRLIPCVDLLIPFVYTSFSTAKAQPWWSARLLAVRRFCNIDFGDKIGGAWIDTQLRVSSAALLILRLFR